MVPVSVPQKMRPYVERNCLMHDLAYASAHGILHPRNIYESTSATDVADTAAIDLIVVCSL